MGGISLTTWGFAAAGAACALGPVIIHLLNRRRYQVIHWGAMDFVRQALRKHRRNLQIRDLVLLALRTAAVLMFGLALARPYLATDKEAAIAGQSLHAIVVIDNSLSMGLSSLSGTSLDRARSEARELILQLPPGSRISLLPTCGTRSFLSSDPYEIKEAAVEALEKIELVERSVSLPALRSELERACQAAPELAKQVVIFSDLQEASWREVGNSLEGLPTIHFVDVASEEWGNTWVADVRVQDGLADVETPTTVTVEIAHQGPAPRQDLQVTLYLGEQILGQKTITLDAGANRQQVDFECSFRGFVEMPSPNRPAFAPLRAVITPDRLAADDERSLLVPVVAALKVVFVDQFSATEEDPAQGRTGETRALRVLMAPRTSRALAPRQLVSVQHVTIDEVNRQNLASARLVVIAGIANPGPAGQLLADYVHLGGQLLICAGGDFDPNAWMQSAWLDGQGILPLPLRGTIGQLPTATTEELRPFFLSVETLLGESFFQLANVPTTELSELFGEPLFFKAVAVDVASSEGAIAKPSAGTRENWLTWRQEGADDPESVAAGQSKPRIVGRFDLPDQSPFLVAREQGHGSIVLCTSGVSSNWNTLPKTNAMVLFDHILRSLILRTLPDRNIEPVDEFTLPLPSMERNTLITLLRPGDTQSETLELTFVTAQRQGVSLEGLLQRGIYRVRGQSPPRSFSQSEAGAVTFEVALAVQGPSEESNLRPLQPSTIASLPAERLVFHPSGDSVELLGHAASGHSTWWWLTGVVLVLLVAEMCVLVWPAVKLAPATGSPGGKP